MLTTLTIVSLIVTIVTLVAFGFLLVPAFKRGVLWGLAVLLLPFATLVYGIKYWQEVKKPFLVYVGGNTLSIALLGFVFFQLGGMQALQMAQQIESGTLSEQQAAQFMVGTMNEIEQHGAGGKEEMLAQMRADPNLTPEDVKQFEAMFGQIENLAAGEQASTSESAVEAPAPDTLAHKVASLEAQMAQLEGVEVAAETAPAAKAETTAAGYPLPEYVASPIKQATAAEQIEKKSSGTISLAEAKHYLGDIVSVTTDDGITRRATLLEVHPDSLEFQRRAGGGSLSFVLKKSDIKTLALN